MPQAEASLKYDNYSKSLIWIKSAWSEWQTRLTFRWSKCQIYRTIVRWPTVICSFAKRFYNYNDYTIRFHVTAMDKNKKTYIWVPCRFWYCWWNPSFSCDHAVIPNSRLISANCFSFRSRACFSVTISSSIWRTKIAGKTLMPLHDNYHNKKCGEKKRVH